MTKKMKNWTLALTATAAVTSLFLTQPAFAQGIGGAARGMMRRPAAAGETVQRPMWADRQEHREEMHAQVAEMLGMSVEELDAARAEGRTLADLAQEKGISLEEIQQKMADQRKAMIEQAVADGNLTQEQADRMLERQTRVGDCTAGQGQGPMGAGRQGMKGMMQKGMRQGMQRGMGQGMGQGMQRGMGQGAQQAAK